MKSTKARIAVILIALVCLLAGMSNGERAAWDCPECGRKGNTGNYCGYCKHPAPGVVPAYAVGDIITFGHYEQDNNLNNGQEAIEWIVLDYNAEENKALLLSRYGLDTKPYHEKERAAVTWGECSLRSWLIGKFFRTAFSAEEQQKILKTKVDNSKSQGYSEWNTDGGNDTVDRLFLLSYRESFEEYLKDNEFRTCKPTAYAIAQGAYIDSSSNNGWWWLRSPGMDQFIAAFVDINGSRFSSNVNSKTGCVRPALWLNLESSHSGQEIAGTAEGMEQSYGSDSLSGYGYTTTTVNFREKADASSARIRELKIYALCKVEKIIEANGDTWYQVTYDRKTGYIKGNYFRQMTIAELEQFLASSGYQEGLAGNAATPIPTEKPTPTPKPRENRAIAVGDIITFGHYEQDNNLNNGQEAIEWIVLDYDAAENKTFLLSRYGLDAKPYHENYGSVTWGKCSLRRWLNGEFLKTAFTADEQCGILKTNVDNGESQGYSGWNTNGGNDTVDQVFLLSYREAFEEYFKDDQSRTCKPTAYAIAHGAFSKSDSGNGWWWLRSPGLNQIYATYVIFNGRCNYSNVYRDSGCIRPALWVNLNSGIF